MASSRRRRASAALRCFSCIVLIVALQVWEESSSFAFQGSSLRYKQVLGITAAKNKASALLATASCERHAGGQNVIDGAYQLPKKIQDEIDKGALDSLVLFTGSFNPVHVGHFAVMEEAVKRMLDDGRKKVMIMVVVSSDYRLDEKAKKQTATGKLSYAKRKELLLESLRNGISMVPESNRRLKDVEVLVDDFWENFIGNSGDIRATVKAACEIEVFNAMGSDKADKYNIMYDNSTLVLERPPDTGSSTEVREQWFLKYKLHLSKQVEQWLRGNSCSQCEALECRSNIAKKRKAKDPKAKIIDLAKSVFAEECPHYDAERHRQLIQQELLYCHLVFDLRETSDSAAHSMKMLAAAGTATLPGERASAVRAMLELPYSAKQLSQSLGHTHVRNSKSNGAYEYTWGHLVSQTSRGVTRVAGMLSVSTFSLYQPNKGLRPSDLELIVSGLRCKTAKDALYKLGEPVVINASVIS